MKEGDYGRREFLKFSGLSALTVGLGMPTESLESPEIKKRTEIIYAGDVMLGRTVMATAQDEGDPNYAFRELGAFLDTADIAFVNLENPVIEDCPRIEDPTNLTFCTTPEIAESLVYAGIDVVTLANNHSRDYGDNGLNETVRQLNRLGVESAGINNLVVKEKGGTKFGFAGLEFVTRSDEEEDYEMIRQFSEDVDVLIVGVHWGTEYRIEPNYYQKRQARRLVEAGADTIVGHHPHVVQPKEMIDGVPVYFSLGNLVFDQMWEKTRRGLMVRQVYEGSSLVSNKLIETEMENVGQPKLVNPYNRKHQNSHNLMR